ncbi:MAG: penicillin-binding protein 2, partial [Campylobacteraceae bacterium]|nr:penicillin-binding protein 2 [Campylobacteraceae bacterium]
MSAKEQNNDNSQNNKNKFIRLFMLIMLGFIIFIAMLFIWSNIDRDLPNFRASETRTAVRGLILSADEYTLAATKRVYEVSIDTRSLDPNKKELF